MAVSFALPVDAWKNEPTFIIGGGSSLAGLDFEQFRGKGHVIAVNNAYAACPWAEYMFFADKRWWEWNKKDVLGFQGEIVSRVRVSEGEGSDRVKRIGRTNRRPLSREANCVAGFCGGSNALNMVYLLGGDPTFLVGFDMYPGNWHKLHKSDHVKGQHRKKFIPFLEWMADELEAEGRRVYNTNPRSMLRRFPFVPLEEVLQMDMDELSRIEHDKYCRVWEHPVYRKVSPGRDLVENAFDVMKLREGDSVIDIGAGTGRAASYLMDRGIHVVAFDLVEEALEDKGIPFVQGSVWAIPKDFERFDWGYCCDLMEHVPTHKIEDSLRGIARICKRGCFFNIATRTDVMGRRTGVGPLHLTVRDGEWWRRQVEKGFRFVDVVNKTGKDITLRAMHDAEDARK